MGTYYQKQKILEVKIDYWEQNVSHDGLDTIIQKATKQSRLLHTFLMKLDRVNRAKTFVTETIIFENLV